MPDAKLFEITSKIIINIAQSTQSAAEFVAKEILPILINTYRITETPSYQVKILRVLVGLSKILNDFFGSNNNFNLEELQQIPILCIAALNHSNLEMKITAWNSIGVLELSDVLKECVFENLRVILIQDLEVALRETLFVSFKTLAIKYPDEIEENVIKKIQIKSTISLKYFLEALARISEHKQFIKVVFPILIRYCLGSVAEAETAFISLRNVLEKHETNTDILNFLVKNLDAIKNTIDWTLKNNIEEKYELLKNIAVVLKILVDSLSRQQQENLLATEVNEIILKCKENYTTVYVVLLHGLLLRLHQKVIINEQIIETVFQIIFQKYSDNRMNDLAIQLFANILNKTRNEFVLEHYLEKTTNIYNTEINNVVINVIAWITKALLLRNHQQTNFWIEKVSKTLSFFLLHKFTYRF